MSAEGPPIGNELTLYQLLHASKWKAQCHQHTPAISSVTSYARPQYDQMMSMTQVIFAELGRQRNALLPINVLPVEVLMRIFIALQDDVEETINDFSLDVFSPFSVQDFLGAYTGVCRHWRRVALSSPLLWRNILLENGADGPATIAKDFVTRSAPGPIRLIYYPRWTRKDQVADIVNFFLSLSKARERLEQLVIPGRGEKKNAHYICNLLRRPLKNLRSLSINCKYSSSVEKQLHALKAPNLRSLTLANAKSIPQQLLLNLTHFELKWHAIHFLGPFLGILRAMPSLQVLILDYAAPYREHGFVQQSLDLPCIKYIWLDDLRAHISEPFVLINKLNISSNAQVSWNDSMTNQNIHKSEMAPPLSMLNSVTHLLLEPSGNANMIQGNCMTMDMRQQSGLFPLLHNIRFLARSAGASDNLYWSSSLPNIEEYHVRADSLKRALVWELERPVSPVFLNLITLCIWKRPWESLDDGIGPFDRKNSELRELGRKLEVYHSVTRTRSNGTTYRIELRSTSGRLLSLDWMLAISNPIHIGKDSPMQEVYSPQMRFPALTRFSRSYATRIISMMLQEDVEETLRNPSSGTDMFPTDDFSRRLHRLLAQEPERLEQLAIPGSIRREQYDLYLLSAYPASQLPS
ncbi:hypothetical protein CPB83DRAFT_943005 [Crepidotus variabilis]|uniref:F-box domain-containing protein n=1 Tax=Crepidotus variabilis TaxID=179855 RepID=A0A9P6EQI6_9AGAR|nr:hypothetical protein CPB83DRAFT_943005 [Crepidotus variabilis]